MSDKLTAKTLILSFCVLFSIGCVQMKSSNDNGTGVVTENNSDGSTTGSRKVFDTTNFMSADRTQSGRIALDFSNKRTIDVSSIVNDTNVESVEYTNEGGTFASYETGAPFRTLIRSAVSGGDVTMTVKHKDGTTRTYTF